MHTCHCEQSEAIHLPLSPTVSVLDCRVAALLAMTNMKNAKIRVHLSSFVVKNLYD